MIKLLSIFTLLSSLAFSSTLSIHDVLPKKDGGVQYKHGNEVVSLSKVPFISDKDIEQVSVDPSNLTLCSVTLSVEGAKKMMKHTAGLERGKSRIAILLNDKLILVATLQADKLGAKLQMNLPDSLTLKEVQEMLKNPHNKG